MPIAATINGDGQANGALSYLPGQRLSRCTCPEESHPGPMHSDGTYVGRSAPEIDVFEAQVCVLHAVPRKWLNLVFIRLAAIRLSGKFPNHHSGRYVYFRLLRHKRLMRSCTGHFCQPFNNRYHFLNNSETVVINNPDVTFLNPYVGGAFQQSTSGVSRTGQHCRVKNSTNSFSRFT